MFSAASGVFSWWEMSVQKGLGTPFLLCMGAQNRGQGVDRMEQPIEVPFLIAGDPGRHVPGKVFLHLYNGLVQEAALGAKIPIQKGNHDQRQQKGGCHQGRSCMLWLPGDKPPRNRSEHGQGQQDTKKQPLDGLVGQWSHEAPHSVVFHL